MPRLRPRGRRRSVRTYRGRYYTVRPPGSAGVGPLADGWNSAALRAGSGRLQRGALRHLPVRQVAPERDRVLDNVARAALGLVLILPREGLQRPGRRANAAPEGAPCRSRPSRPIGHGGDDDPAAHDRPQAQPEGGLRAGAWRQGSPRRRLRASPAVALASSPGSPEGDATGGGAR